MIQIPPAYRQAGNPSLPSGSETALGRRLKGGERGDYNLSLFLGPIYPLTPTIQTPPKWRGYIGLFYSV